MPKRSVRIHARCLLRRITARQKDAYLELLSKSFGSQFAEQVARYADSHPVLR